MHKKRETAIEREGLANRVPPPGRDGGGVQHMRRALKSGRETQDGVW